jgi:hypothetical protein
MNRGDKLEGQIRAVLAAEAGTRRLVAVRTPPAVSARLVRGALTLGTAALVIVGALAIGSSVRALRSSPVASEPQAATQGAAVGVCAAARQRVLGMFGVITRLDRIEVKRMTAQDLDAGRDPLFKSRPATPPASDTVLCVVAVGGEIRQTMGLIATGPFSWSLFVSTAGADDSIISTSSGQNGTWPPYFDALPNRQPNPYPGTVVEAVGPDIFRLRLESAMLSAEFGNPVLLRANRYTEIVPTAPTITATGVKPGDRVEVSFEREGRDSSSGAYVLSTFRIVTSVSLMPLSNVVPLGFALPVACLVNSYVRATDGASATWTFTCRAGVMTREAWREQLRAIQLQTGWREIESQGTLLQFAKDDFGLTMTIQPEPPDGAFAVTQRLRLGEFPPSAVDCGRARVDASGRYDQALLDCVWSSYVGGRAARLEIIMTTQEGDPIPTSLYAVPGSLSEVTRDLTADRFANAVNRIVTRYACVTLAPRLWATDPSRYSFELTDCVGGPGPKATTSFP